MDSLTPSTVSLAGQRGLVADGKALGHLNTLAGKDSKAAIKETARQFEALFMQELLKSMRDASMKSGLIENQESDLGTQLLDQQWAQMMTGTRGGLSELIEKQLSQQVTPQAQASGGGAAAGSTVGQAARSTLGRVGAASGNQVGFVSQHTQAAQQVAQESGIPASFMIGQAGHETGWGRSEIRHADGRPAFNLFGIKAGAGWKGKVAEVTTTEYINGQPQKVTAKFRAYDSYADSFRDYARLIGNSPRYADAMNNLHSAQAFASSLQRGGYATDPQYAAKLSRAINTTLNLQRAQA
jgi:peptidoglycan hydrolase FlgJ